MATGKFSVLYIYTDAGSRGNPGNAAIAFTIYDDKGNIVSENSKFIGRTTNNVAEYRALIVALEEAYNFCRGEIFCFSDSERVVKQLKGKEKSKVLKEYFDKVKILAKMFKQVTYSHLPRENPKIKRVDKLVNKELDKFRIIIY